MVPSAARWTRTRPAAFGGPALDPVGLVAIDPRLAETDRVAEQVVDADRRRPAAVRQARPVVDLVVWKGARRSTPVERQSSAELYRVQLETTTSADGSRRKFASDGRAPFGTSDGSLSRHPSCEAAGQSDGSSVLGPAPSRRARRRTIDPTCDLSPITCTYEYLGVLHLVMLVLMRSATSFDRGRVALARCCSRRRSSGPCRRHSAAHRSGWPRPVCRSRRSRGTSSGSITTTHDGTGHLPGRGPRVQHGKHCGIGRVDRADLGHEQRLHRSRARQPVDGRHRQPGRGRVHRRVLQRPRLPEQRRQDHVAWLSHHRDRRPAWLA